MAQPYRRVRRFEVSEWRCICQRCGHRWTSIRTTKPITCASCKARAWDQPPKYRRK